MEVNIKSIVDEEWPNFVLNYGDIFLTSYCGYWMYGMERDPVLGWLCYEHGEEKTIPDVLNDPSYDQIVAMWKVGETLPERWFALNKEMVAKAWAEGVKMWGLLWFIEADATSYDIVLQKAFFNEVRYG